MQLALNREPRPPPLAGGIVPPTLKLPQDRVTSATLLPSLAESDTFLLRRLRSEEQVWICFVRNFYYFSSFDVMVREWKSHTFVSLTGRDLWFGSMLYAIFNLLRHDFHLGNHGPPTLTVGNFKLKQDIALLVLPFY